MSEAFAGKKPEQAGFAGMPIEQTPSSLRWSLVDHVSKQDAELARLRAENEKLRTAVLKADEFIQNGIELGYIREPKMVDDPGYYTPSVVRAAAAALKGTGDE